jgi:hypothetical protein
MGTTGGEQRHETMGAAAGRRVGCKHKLEQTHRHTQEATPPGLGPARQARGQTQTAPPSARRPPPVRSRVQAP